MTKRILTIDDSKTMRDMLMLTLVDAGFDVLQAVDGQDGVDVLGDERVDVVITDINMPKMDGYEVIRQLRQQSGAQGDADPGADDRKRHRQEEHRARSRRHRMDGQAIRSGASDRDRSQGFPVSRADADRGLTIMSSLDQLKQTFFDECSELLQQIETGLTEMREGSGTDDTINAVFRAVHSVKGGAGIFGFEALVEIRPCVRDRARCHPAAATWRSTPDSVDVLLAASDVLADLVAMSRAGEAIPPELRQRMPRGA